MCVCVETICEYKITNANQCAESERWQEKSPFFVNEQWVCRMRNYVDGDGNGDDNSDYDDVKRRITQNQCVPLHIPIDGIFFFIIQIVIICFIEPRFWRMWITDLFFEPNYCNVVFDDGHSVMFIVNECEWNVCDSSLSNELEHWASIHSLYVFSIFIEKIRYGNSIFYSSGLWTLIVLTQSGTRFHN